VSTDEDEENQKPVEKVEKSCWQERQFLQNSYPSRRTHRDVALWRTDIALLILDYIQVSYP
jgi:hypothetical protein